MALFTPPEDLLIRAMLAKQLQVRLNHCIGPLDLVFKSALKKNGDCWPFCRPTRPVT